MNERWLILRYRAWYIRNALLLHSTRLVARDIHPGGIVRQGGVLKHVPAAWKTRVIDFGAGPVKAVTIPWGDISTAYHSTGIPKVEVYTAAPFSLRLAAQASRYLGSRPVQGPSERVDRAA